MQASICVVVCSSIFLWKLLRLNSTIMASLCVQLTKGGYGLLREVPRGEGECFSGLKREGEGRLFISCDTAI